MDKAKPLLEAINIPSPFDDPKVEKTPIYAIDASVLPTMSLEEAQRLLREQGLRFMSSAGQEFYSMPSTVANESGTVSYTVTGNVYTAGIDPYLAMGDNSAASVIIGREGRVIGLDERNGWVEEAARLATEMGASLHQEIDSAIALVIGEDRYRVDLDALRQQFTGAYEAQFQMYNRLQTEIATNLQESNTEITPEMNRVMDIVQAGGEFTPQTELPQVQVTSTAMLESFDSEEDMMAYMDMMVAQIRNEDTPPQNLLT